MPSMMDSEPFDGTISTAEEARRMCVLGNRMLALDQVMDAFGHVTVRNPEDPNTFFIAWATSPAFVTLDDLLLCDFEGNILSKDTRRPYGERILHSRIYKARPDVNAICHGHPSSVQPFYCTNIPLIPVGGGGIFIDGIPILEEWDPESGIHIATIDAGDSLAQALGGNRAALIRNHGIVTVGNCVQELVVVSNSLVKMAESLFRILQIGGTPIPVNPEIAKKSSERSLASIGIERNWNYKLRGIKAAYPDLYDML